jgi:hypothetical protein
MGLHRRVTSVKVSETRRVDGSRGFVQICCCLALVATLNAHDDHIRMNVVRNRPLSLP